MNAKNPKKYEYNLIVENCRSWNGEACLMGFDDIIKFIRLSILTYKEKGRCGKDIEIENIKLKERIKYLEGKEYYDSIKKQILTTMK